MPGRREHAEHRFDDFSPIHNILTTANIAFTTTSHLACTRQVAVWSPPQISSCNEFTPLSSIAGPLPTALRNCLAMCVLALAWITDARSQTAPTEVIDVQQEFNVKGAYLYSFSRYVKWPESAFATDDNPFVIGVFGDAPIGAILERVRATKKVGERSILIHRFDDFTQYQDCHILFITRSIETEVQQTVLKQLETSPVLLVGETPEFSHWGGIINFFISNGRVRFEINPESARQHKLAIDAKLLRIGHVAGAE